MATSCCDIEVDVNGEEIFMVDKKIVALYSGWLRRLLGRSSATARNLKVIFHNFPGGPESFELMLKFCYNNGKAEINPSNFCLLHCAAKFMDIPNLLKQTEEFIKELNYWTWSELLVALNQCQELYTVADSSFVLDKCLDSLVGKLALVTEASPCSSSLSLDSSGFRFSTDTKSTESLKTSSSRATWWFEDLSFLSPNLVEVVVKSMLARKLDRVPITKFLIHYQKSKFFNSTADEKRKTLKFVIDMLYSLEKSSVSLKSLFDILRVAMGFNTERSYRIKLETMIGSRLDQATLDNLLIASPNGMKGLYDVNLVLRFLKAFMRSYKVEASILQLKRVAILVDMYMAEVAPDPGLKSSKFLALATALPDSSRDTIDEMYHAVDIYLEAHAGLSEEEKTELCCALNYGKLSTEACLHIAKNPRFPPESSIKTTISQHSKLKSLLHGVDNSKAFAGSFSSREKEESKSKKCGTSEQVVLCAQTPGHSSGNEKAKARLQGMQWKVVELERIWQKMQAQMAKARKSGMSDRRRVRSLPRICS